MSRDDASDFRVRTGRIRDRGAPSGRRTRSFVEQVMRAAAKANGGPLTPRQIRGETRSGKGGTRPKKGRCSRIGRGQAAADRLKKFASERGPGERLRRVVIKARIVRLKTGSRAADAHLRYLQRDGTTRDGERGRLYGPDNDSMDGSAFAERGREDRHQFRFIVAPEDGDRLSDLRAFTRDVMTRMEEDLGTKLDWVAVDHFDTGHPHSHVVIRGKDDLGKDLVIAQDYITDGMRIRAQERATLELGPETDRELREKLRAEITAERFTRIDRAMIAEAKDSILDLRPEAGQVRADFDRTLRLGRLQTLERYGLAKEGAPGVWALSEKLEPTMRELGERCDIVKTINRALANRGEDRALGSYVLHRQSPTEPVVGRVIDKQLADELGDSVGLVVDGIDGRVHHVIVPDAGVAAEARIGAIVEIGPERVGPRPADRNIAGLARAFGEYRPSMHEKMAEAESIRVPGDDYGAYVEAHVRRLEALRRAGLVERIDADRWRIPEDFEHRAAAYDSSGRRAVALRVLSAYDLDRQVPSDGATWLDRQIVGSEKRALAAAGFGAEVQDAKGRRAEELVRQGHGRWDEHDRLRLRKNLLATLERQELERVGQKLATERGLPYRHILDGELVRGKLVGSTRLASGRYAMIDSGLGFALVPWRPVIEKEIGREVAMMRGGGVSWQLGRALGPGM